MSEQGVGDGGGGGGGVGVQASRDMSASEHEGGGSYAFGGGGGGLSESERAELQSQVSACQEKLKQINDKMATFDLQVARAPNAPMKKRLQQQAEVYAGQVLMSSRRSVYYIHDALWMSSSRRVITYTRWCKRWTLEYRQTGYDRRCQHPQIHACACVL